MTQALSTAVKGEYVEAADGVRLHFHRVGDGPPLVWLHGSGPGASGLSNFAGNLPAFSAFHSFVFDLARFGRSDVPVIREPMILFHARQVVAALDRLGVQRASFIGNSLGGAIAAKIAIDRPDLVDRLVMMGAGGTNPPQFEPTDGIRALWAAAQAGYTPQSVEVFLRTAVYDDAIVTDELIAERAADAARPEVVATLAESNAEGTDLRPDLHRIQAPALLLWGRDDRVMPLEWGFDYARLVPDIEFLVLPRCGHWVQIEKRRRFDALVTAFLLGEED
jgi:4,5:9,10-diseco-3-hydroxy-5,9,17-trioxoandrosta-1(10),2-diene-4-oate hydrolase